MRRFEEVEDDFDGVEGLDGHFHEGGKPVGHGSVPESGELEGFQFAALIALGADASCLGIHMLEEVELLAAEVAQAAYEIHGIEMGRFLHQ